LFERGYNSFDSDEIPGLARAEDLSGKPTDVDWSKFVDYSAISFNWQGQVLRAFLTDHPDIFICGSASNQLDFHSLFDSVFVLVVDKATHKQHLTDRVSEYGKDPAMLAYLLDEQQAFTEQALRLGAIAIDATHTPEQTTDEIIGHIHDMPKMARTSS
jgi:hypothetical protein